MIKSKEDARQWLLEIMGTGDNTKWEGIFYILNKVQEEHYYSWNANGARILYEDGQITFEQLIDSTFKLRKLINEEEKDFQAMLHCTGKYKTA